MPENVLYLPNGTFLPYSFGFLIPVLICLVIVKSPQLVNIFSLFWLSMVLDCFTDAQGAPLLGLFKYSVY